MSNISYAQNFEDVMLWRALGNVSEGFYIDIGACSPDEHSVTRLFSDNGWRGINVEPHAFFFSQLTEKRSRDINLNLAVGDHIGQVTMHFIDGTGLSTGVADIAETHSHSGWQSEKKDVPLVTLSHIWEMYVPKGQSVHFLKIDVEGFEKAVLEGNDWQENRPWILVIEATEPLTQTPNHKNWENLVLVANYKHCYSDGLNRYYIAKEHFDSLKAFFKLPPNIFDDFRVSALIEAQSEVNRLAADADKFTAERVQIQHQLQSTRSELRSLQLEHQQLATELQHAEQRAREVERLYNAESEKNNALLCSTSWKMTAPFRKLSSLLK